MAVAVLWVYAMDVRCADADMSIAVTVGVAVAVAVCHGCEHTDMSVDALGRVWMRSQVWVWMS